MSEARRSRSASVAKEQAPQGQVGKAQTPSKKAGMKTRPKARPKQTATVGSIAEEKEKEQEQEEQEKEQEEQEKEQEQEKEKEAGEKEAGRASGKEATAGGSGVGRKGEKRPAKGNVSGSGTTKTAAAQRGDAKGKGKAKAVEAEESEEDEDEDTEGELEGEDEAEAQAEAAKAAKAAKAQAEKVGGAGSSSRTTGGTAPTATMSQRDNAPAPADDDQDVIVQDHPKLWTNQPAQLSHDNTTEAELAKQRLGYAFVNLLDPEIRFSWGRYVNRAIDKAHVKKLKDSFEQGIMNWKSEIPIVLDEDCVDVNSLSNEGVAREDINMARWRAAAKRKTVHVLGGGHRVQALRERREELQKKLEKERAKLKEKYLDEKKAETKQGKAQRERLAEIERLEEEIKRTGYWLVCFYKQDGFTQAHGEYTSRNDDKPSKHQGGVERLVGWCVQTQEFVSRMEDPPEIGTAEWIQRVIDQRWDQKTRHSHTREFRLLNNRFTFQFLLRLSGFRYLRDGANVTFSQLRTVGDSMNGGFGHLWVLMLEAKLAEMEFIASAHPANEKGYADALNALVEVLEWRLARMQGQMDRAREMEAARKELKTRSWRERVYREYEEAMEGLVRDVEMDEVFSVGLMNRLDKLYVQHVHDAWQFASYRDEGEGKDGEFTTAFQEGMEGYFEAADGLMKRYWRQQAEEGARKGSKSANQLAALRGAGDKLNALRRLRDHSQYQPLPWPTGSFIWDSFARLNEVNDAIRFMVRIVDPLCDSRRLLQNTDLLDHSSCLVRLLENKAICSNDRRALKEIAEFVFSMMAELYDVQAFLQRGDFHLRNHPLFSYTVSKWGKLGEKRTSTDPWYEPLAPFITEWPTVYNKHVDDLHIVISNHIRWTRSRELERERENKALANPNAKRPRRAKVETSGGRPVVPITPENAGTKPELLMLMRNADEFISVSKSLGPKNAQALAFQTFVLNKIMKDLHGPIYASPSGRSLRKGLLGFLTHYRAAEANNIFTKEQLADGRIGRQFANWDLFAAEVYEAEGVWHGKPLNVQLGANEDLLSMQKRQQEHVKTMNAIVKKLLSTPALQHDPLAAQQSEDVDHEGLELSELVREPLQRFLDAVSFNIARQEIRARAPYPAPLVPTADDMSIWKSPELPEGQSDDCAFESLEAFEQGAPDQYRMYTGLVEQHFDKDALKNPMAVAPPQHFAHVFVPEEEEQDGEGQDASSAVPPRDSSSDEEDEMEIDPPAGSQHANVLKRRRTGVPVKQATGSHPVDDDDGMHDDPMVPTQPLTSQEGAASDEDEEEKLNSTDEPSPSDHEKLRATARSRKFNLIRHPRTTPPEDASDDDHLFDEDLYNDFDHQAEIHGIQQSHDIDVDMENSSQPPPPRQRRQQTPAPRRKRTRNASPASPSSSAPPPKRQAPPAPSHVPAQAAISSIAAAAAADRDASSSAPAPTSIAPPGPRDYA
ncbi:hypothetical protein ACG7TL_007383 [Trametes sanguinea]